MAILPEVTFQRADDAAVHDDQHRPPSWASPIVVDRRRAPASSSASSALVARGPAARLEGSRPALLDLGAGVALPLAGVALAQPRVDAARRRRRSLGDDLGGAPGALEVGRPDRVDGVDVRGGVGGLLLAQRRRAEGRPDPASDRRRSTSTRRGARGAASPGAVRAAPDRRPARSARSCGLDAQESLGQVPRREPGGLGRGLAPRPHALGGARGIGHLARVAAATPRSCGRTCR